MYSPMSSFSLLALFLSVLLRSDFGACLQVVPPPPHLLESTTTKATTPSNVSSIPNVTLSSTTSSQGVKINHDRTTTVTTPLPNVTTLSTSEVSDMTSNSTYHGGIDVDEIGNKTKHDKPTKEQSKTHSKSTTTQVPSTATSKPSTTSTIQPSTTSTTQPSTTTAVKSSTEKSSTIPSANMTVGNSSHIEAAAKKSIENRTTAAGVVAIVCVVIAVSAFSALLAWRYVYRKRHGNREILINEEDIDFNDEDLRHFEATSIQLEPEA